MPRKKFIGIDTFPYHVTCRCINKEWFALPTEEIWEIFSIYLHFVSRAFNLRIHSFVLMSNHFHMIVSTPDCNLDLAMNYLLREVSKSIGIRVGRNNQIFGGPYFWSILKSKFYVYHAYKYVYRNPVEAGLSQAVESYKFSTLGHLLGSFRESLLIPVEEDVELFSNPEEHLAWLNSSYNPENLSDIRKAIRRREFKFTVGKDRIPHPLENKIV